MGRLIDEQAVIECLTNTAKYYEREDADEWTKGIHYGLLHGLDNILDNVPTVEAIPKVDYENRLKADMVVMLTELKTEIKELDTYDIERVHGLIENGYISKEVEDLIQQRIDKLKEKYK